MPITYGSVCSGIEAATVAWHPLGWRAAWYAEIEPFPCAVLAHHYPTTPNHGDMTRLAAMVLSGKIPAPEVLVGGTPCQAFSVAGMREGLADPRGALTIKYVELFDAIDHVRTMHCQPEAVCLWENVPGVLSDKGNAFGCFLGALVGESEELQPPGGQMEGRWLCVWTHANSRMADSGCPIFRPGPTTPPCVRCRKCSSRVRSPRSTF
jgi:DNA (cytosine-5)-methyltransferase 1